MHAGIGGLVAEQEVEAVLLVCQGGEGDGGSGGLVDLLVGIGDFFFLLVHFEVEGGGLHAPDAAETPLGGDHLVDEVHFYSGLREEFFDVVEVQVVEDGLRFVGEDYGFRG